MWEIMKLWDFACSRVWLMYATLDSVHSVCCSTVKTSSPQSTTSSCWTPCATTCAVARSTWSCHCIPSRWKPNLLTSHGWNDYRCIVCIPHSGEIPWQYWLQSAFLAWPQRFCSDDPFQIWRQLRGGGDVCVPSGGGHSRVQTPQRKIPRKYVSLHLRLSVLRRLRHAVKQVTFLQCSLPRPGRSYWATGRRYPSAI